EKQICPLASFQWIPRGDERWLAHGGGPLQGKYGRDDGDRRSRAFRADATRCDHPRDRRRRLRLPRSTVEAAWDSRRGGLGGAKSWQRVEKRRESSDRFGA